MKSLNEIEIILKKNKKNLEKRYPIKTMAIFGSFARNEATPESDIDIMVEFDDQIGIRFIDLADEIEKMLGYKVDLASKKTIKEKYLNIIEPELIYA